MEKWRVLSHKLHAEGGDTFLLERTSPESLRLAYEAGRGVIIEMRGQIVACGFLWTTDDPTILEPGTLWVDPVHRDKGLSSTVAHLRLQLIPAGTRCFIISHEDKVAHLAEKGGFVEADAATWFAHIPDEYSCGPCDRVPYSEKAACPLRGVKAQCRLFVRTGS